MAESVERTQARQELLDLGLSPGLSVLLLLVGALGTLVVVVLALDALSRDRPAFDGSLLDGFAWRTGNMVAGALIALVAYIAMFIVVGIVGIFAALIPILGLLLLPVVVLVPIVAFVTLFFYFPAGIAIDGKNAIEAISDSFDTSRDHFVGTLGLVGVWILLSLVSLVLSVAFLYVLPPAASLLVGQFVGAAIWILALGFVARAYVAVTESPTDDTGPDPATDTWAAEDTRNF